MAAFTPAQVPARHASVRRHRRRTGLAQFLLTLAALGGIAMAVASAAFSDQFPDITTGGDSAPRADDQPPAPEATDPEPPPSAPADEAELPDSDPRTPVLRQNSFYDGGGVDAVDCPAPPLQDVTTDDQRGYYETVFACLVDAWEPLLDRTGNAAPVPELFVFDQAGESPCGSFQPRTGSILAFYCPANQTMYADVEQMAVAFPPEDHIAYALVLAHEYGHHLQLASGLLDAERHLGYEYPELEASLSRRTEVQASCFAGMFVNGIQDSYPVTGQQADRFAFYAYNFFGDPPDAAEAERTHGQPQTQGRWIEVGFDENSTGSCNSFVASAEDIE